MLAWMAKMLILSKTAKQSEINWPINQGRVLGKKIQESKLFRIKLLLWTFW